MYTKKIHTSPLAAPPTFFWSFLMATISKLIPPGQSESWGETRFLRINSSVKRWHISAYLQAVPGWVLMYLPWSSKTNAVISFLAASKHLFSWNLEIKSLSFCSVHRSPGLIADPKFIPNWNDSIGKGEYHRMNRAVAEMDHNLTFTFLCIRLLLIILSKVCKIQSENNAKTSEAIN